MITKLCKYIDFPKVTSVEQEYKKAGILRFVLGIVVLVRFAENGYSAYYLDGNITSVVWVTLLLSFLFTIKWSYRL